MPTTPQRLGLPHWTVIRALTLSLGFASVALGNFYISSMQTFSDITFDFSPEAYDCAILPPDAAADPSVCPEEWVNAQDVGCFLFLGEDPALSWFDASVACEQVSSPQSRK